jgi:hypothetical protein
MRSFVVLFMNTSGSNIKNMIPKQEANLQISQSKKKQNLNLLIVS